VFTGRPLSADDDGGDWSILRGGTEPGAAALRGFKRTHGLNTMAP